MADLQLTFAQLSKDRRLSPLACYIAAHRLGRPQLASRFALGAAQQHSACPLYRAASRSLLPVDLYPMEETPVTQGSLNGPRTFRQSIVMN